MPKFAPFTQAGTAPTPGFAQAQAMDERLKQQQEQQARALRSQNILGGAQLYNAGMGENSFLADKLTGWFGGGETAAAIPTATEAAIPAGVIDTSALVLAPEVATAGGAEVAAGAGAINPYVAAALAGYGLTQTDIGKEVGQGMLDIGGGLMGKGWLWS